ncbi:hypothetical protein [Flavobacterium sp. KJJ]|uniref:hypothetical protein n=1 Tax=Flavobacterium sp. KJJ TaxID=1270193 RepID=UPI0004938DCE|nr:hypothetical protein [Flavobacterium sp. KJJ]
MKKNFTILFLILTLAGYSQQLSYKSGGTVYNAENKRLNSNEVRSLLANNSEALALYNAGRSKKTFGNVFFYGGLGLVTANLLFGMNSDPNYSSGGYNPNPSEKTNMTAAIIGGALIIASIPIKIGYPKKIKSALEKYNSGLATTYKPAPKTTLVASANQIGFRVEF